MRSCRSFLFHAGLCLAALPIAWSPCGGAAAQPALPQQSAAPSLDQRIWVGLNGKETGPFDPATIRQKIASGEIKPDTLVWGASMKSWERAKDVPALAPLFAQSAPPPAPSPAPPPVPPAVSGNQGHAPAQPGQQNAPGNEEAVKPPPGVDVAELKASAARERENFGVAPTSDLHEGSFEAPTPASIPGGQVITTLGLISMVDHRPAIPMVILDALGARERLPNAIPASWAAGGWSLDDRIESQLARELRQATGGTRDIPIVVYCRSPHCWMSYNVALRVIHLGYSNVLWYRGGLDAWQAAGLPTEPQQMR